MVVAPGIDEGHRAQVKLAAEVGEQDMILDVGPETAAGIAERIQQAATILWNGPLGVFEQEAFANGTQVLADAIASSALSLWRAAAIRWRPSISLVWPTRYPTSLQAAALFWSMLRARSYRRSRHCKPEHR